MLNSLHCTNNFTKTTFTYISTNKTVSIVFYHQNNHLSNNNYLYIIEPVPKGAPSDTSSVCGLALILIVYYLFHCLACLTETLKRNKSSYEQAECQHTKKDKNLHCCVQLTFNLKTVKKHFLSDIIQNVCMFLFLGMFTLKMQQLSVTCCVHTCDKHKRHLLL